MKERDKIAIIHSMVAGVIVTGSILFAYIGEIEDAVVCYLCFAAFSVLSATLYYTDKAREGEQK